MTYSPVRSMLRQVSFFSRGAPGEPGAAFRRDTQMMHRGGSADAPVKNENGARLVEPSSFSVEVQAMGRGRMVAICQKYARSGDRSRGSTLTPPASRTARR